MVHIFVISMTLFGLSHGLFFGGGSGCGCRPRQCSCAAPLPVRSYCPPSSCGRLSPSYEQQPYAPVSFRPPPPTIIQEPYFSVPQPIPIQTRFPNSYRQTPVSQQQPPILTSSYNVPSTSLPSYISFPQSSPIQVSSSKDITANSFDTVIQKSGSATAPEKNDLDIDNALSNFESSLQAYKSMNGIRGVRRAQVSKTQKPEKCSSVRLQEIMEEAMTSNVSISKLRISQLAKNEFGYNFDVVCSQFDFSYLISSNIYCRVEQDGQTCLAYEN